MNIKQCLLISCCLLSAAYLKAQEKTVTVYKEQYRPQIHFSPAEKWMNDPNGMVFYKGVYHLFFQYYPNATVWGPMHWGHAESADMIHWKQMPIALYPDSLGYIFSGSAVVDEHNTSGFGKNGQVPLVAIFCQHDPVGEKAGKDNFQTQSIAYSLDEGQTWAKYPGNPVLKNPGIKDFRDPKVMWYAPGNKWVMTLATKDRITFYSSPNLKDWTKESEFGRDKGDHGGVWECPDLFPLQLDGKTHWVLLVSNNPGGPNGGSGTQYFIGDFDGKTFTTTSTDTKWIDYGPDDYAGVTWANTGSRKIFLGWMSNWTYATQVPTEKWRNAMTVPRELALKQIDRSIFLTSAPVKELAQITLKPLDIAAKGNVTAPALNSLPAQYILKFKVDNIAGYSIVLSNNAGEKLIIGYDRSKNRYYIDRTKPGKIDFNAGFAGTFFAPRISSGSSSDVELIVDASSVELFADNGLSVMSSVFFPNKPYDHLQFQNDKGAIIKNVEILPLKSIW